MAHSRVEREAKYALHEGGRNALNIYSNSGAGYLGFAYYPKNVNAPLRHDLDGVVMAFDSMPGGTIPNYNLGFTGDARGRPLARPRAHVPERLLDDGRPRRRHAGRALPDLGLPGVPGHVHGCPALDPIHNYMDYSYDPCYTEFTAGQGKRMAEQWLFFRAPYFLVPARDNGGIEEVGPS